MKIMKIFLAVIAIGVILSIASISAEDIDNNISISDDNGYNETLSSNDLSINNNDTKESVNLVSDNITMYYKNGTRFSASLYDSNNTPLVNKTLEFSINGISYNKTTNESGVASIALNLESDTYNALVKFNGDINYLKASTNVTIKILPVIEGYDLTKYCRNSSYYYATFLDNQGNPLTNKNVTFNIHGVFYTRTTNASGVAKLNINLLPGEYIITAIHPDNNYMVSNTINILSTINSENITKGYKDSKQFIATFLDGEGNPLKNRNVTFNIHGVFYTRTTNASGMAKLNINLEPGEYILTVIHPDTKYSSGYCINVTKNLNTYETISDTVYSKKIAENIVFTLYNSYNNVLKDKKVSITINNKKETYTTDLNGQVIINNTYDEGIYNGIIVFDGDDYYKSSSKNFTIEVYNGEKVNFTVLSDNVLFKGENFTILVKDYENNILTNKEVVFESNGVKTTTKTNSKGLSSLTLNKVGSYIVKYYVNDKDYANNSQSSKINVYSTPETTLIANSTKIIRGTSFNVLLKAGNMGLANKTIKLNINGVNYTRVTDANGYAKITINLIASNYTFKYWFEGDSKFNKSYNSSNVKVIDNVKTSIVCVSQTKFNSSDNSYFKVKLTDENGPLANQTVTFTFNGETKESKTNISGIATYNINSPMVGTYKIKYTFAGTIGYASCQGETTITVTSSSNKTHLALNDIINGAVNLTSYYSNKKSLPNTVIIGGYSFTLQEALYAFSKAMININNGDKSKIVLPSNISPAESTLDYSDSGVLNKAQYLDVFLRASNYILNHGQAPNYGSSDIGKIYYLELIESSARILDSYNTNKELPSSVTIKPTSSEDIKTVAGLATKLTEGLTSEYDKALALYNYVRDYISYQYYYNTQKGAQGTLDEKSGNCCDQAQLLVAMCRVAGLTARFVHGTCRFSDGTFGHVWAQIMIDGTWTVADPTSTRNSLGVIKNWNTQTATIHGYYDVLPF